MVGTTRTAKHPIFGSISAYLAQFWPKYFFPWKSSFLTVIHFIDTNFKQKTKKTYGWKYEKFAYWDMIGLRTQKTKIRNT